MENNDFSEIIKKFNNILKDKNIDINQFSTDEASKQQGDFNLDINTILKFKKVIDQINNSNNSRNQLLTSLRPFLRSSRQQKLDKYIKIANIIDILAIINDQEGDDSSDTG